MEEETRWKERWKPFTPLSTTRFKIKFKLIHQTPEKSLWLQETLLESPRPSQSRGLARIHRPPEPCRNNSLKLKDDSGRSLLFLFSGAWPEGRLSGNGQVQWPALSPESLRVCPSLANWPLQPRGSLSPGRMARASEQGAAIPAHAGSEEGTDRGRACPRWVGRAGRQHAWGK